MSNVFAIIHVVEADGGNTGVCSFDGLFKSRGCRRCGNDTTA